MFIKWRGISCRIDGIYGELATVGRLVLWFEDVCKYELKFTETGDDNRKELDSRNWRRAVRGGNKWGEDKRNDQRTEDDKESKGAKIKFALQNSVTHALLADKIVIQQFDC